MVQTLLHRFSKSLVLCCALLFGLAIAVLSVAPINRVTMGTRPHYAASASMVYYAAVWHLTVHVLIFGMAALVAWFATEFVADSATNKFLAIVVTLLLGCTTEWLQHTVYKQSIELNDVYTNVISSAVVFAVLIAYATIKKRRQSTQPLDNSFILRDLDD